MAFFIENDWIPNSKWRIISGTNLLFRTDSGPSNKWVNKWVMASKHSMEYYTGFDDSYNYTDLRGLFEDQECFNSSGSFYIKLETDELISRLPEEVQLNFLFNINLLI